MALNQAARGVQPRDRARSAPTYDALPTHLHVNLAASWAKKGRLAVPDGLRVHFADVAVGEQA